MQTPEADPEFISKDSTLRRKSILASIITWEPSRAAVKNVNRMVSALLIRTVDVASWNSWIGSSVRVLLAAWDMFTRCVVPCKSYSKVCWKKVPTRCAVFVCWRNWIGNIRLQNTNWDWWVTRGVAKGHVKFRKLQSQVCLIPSFSCLWLVDETKSQLGEFWVTSETAFWHQINAKAHARTMFSSLGARHLFRNYRTLFWAQPHPTTATDCALMQRTPQSCKEHWLQREFSQMRFVSPFPGSVSEGTIQCGLCIFLTRSWEIVSVGFCGGEQHFYGGSISSHTGSTASGSGKYVSHHTTQTYCVLLICGNDIWKPPWEKKNKFVCFDACSVSPGNNFFQTKILRFRSNLCLLAGRITVCWGRWLFFFAPLVELHATGQNNKANLKNEKTDSFSSNDSVHFEKENLDLVRFSMNKAPNTDLEVPRCIDRSGLKSQIHHAKFEEFSFCLCLCSLWTVEWHWQIYVLLKKLQSQKTMLGIKPNVNTFKEMNGCWWQIPGEAEPLNETVVMSLWHLIPPSNGSLYPQSTSIFPKNVGKLQGSKAHFQVRKIIDTKNLNWQHNLVPNRFARADITALFWNIHMISKAQILNETHSHVRFARSIFGSDFIDHIVRRENGTNLTREQSIWLTFVCLPFFWPLHKQGSTTDLHTETRGKVEQPTKYE